MDTEFILPYQDFDINDITLFEYTDEGLQIITSYVEITRHVQEIHQLFEVYRYNLKRLLSIFELNNSDTIKRHSPRIGDFSDQIELNALIINYISSGKTLVDAIQACVKASYPTGTSEYKNFTAFLSSTYDDCFSYRLLTRLRDFAQHGHLPVSLRNNIACFDIAQIINTPHFHHNKAILKEMEKFNEELLVNQKAYPHHVFTLSVAEYTASMCNVYHTFWTAIHSAFLSKEQSLRTLIKELPECIIHKNTTMNGWLFYIMDETLHAFNTEDDSLALFSQCLDEAERICKEEEKELNEFRKTIRMVKLEE